MGRIVAVRPTGPSGTTGRARGRGGRGRTGGGQSVRLSVRAAEWNHVPARGDSISVSGCCLTVAQDVDPVERIFAFDVVPETLRKTKLGQLTAGDCVNLEHAATLSTLLGGHLVQGHVDGVAEVVHVQRPAVASTRRSSAPAGTGEWRVRIAVPLPADNPAEDLMQYLIPKGSVCVDGVSLTVAALWARNPTLPPRAFEVALIPETLERTTLASLRRGQVINLEVDAIAKTVVHWLREFGTARTATVTAPRRRPR